MSDPITNPFVVNTVAAFLAYVFAFVLARTIRECWSCYRRLLSPLPPTDPFSGCGSTFKPTFAPTLPSKISVEPESPSEPSFEDTLKSLEEKRGTKIFFLTGSRGSSGIFSNIFPANDSFTLADAENFVTTLRKIQPDTNIDLIINSSGHGNFTASEIIATALLNHGGIVNVFVPFRATSGATLISFAGDRIYLGQNAFLGPFDSSWCGFSVPGILRNLPEEGTFMGLWKLVGEHLQKDVKRTARLLSRISEHREEWDSHTLVRIEKYFISGGKFEHDQPLFYDRVAFLGTVVDHKSFPEEIYDIYEKYRAKNTSQRGFPGPLGNLFG